MITFTHSDRIRETPRLPTPSFVNADAVTGLVDYRALGIRDRTYRVEPFPFRDSIALQQLLLEMREASERPAGEAGADRRYLAALDGICAFARKFLIPTTPWTAERLFWRLLRWRPFNPTRGLTETEVVAVAGFFWKCRTQPTARVRPLPDPRVN